LDDETSKYQLLLVNSGINNSIIEAQITLYNSLLLQMQSHLDYTSEQNPMIVYQEKEINNLRDKIRTNINNHIHTLDIQLSTIQSYYDEATSKIISNPVQAKHLATIERERKVKESLYMFLLQKKEENEISMTYRSSNAHIIDLPHGSDKPSSPKKKNVIFAALLLGIMIPVVVIFLRNAMSESVNDGSDIESRGDLPFLGEVPFSGKRHLFSFLKQMLPFLKRFQKQSVRKRDLVVGAGWNNPVNEAFRMIRTRFEATIDQQAEKGKVYQVTSAKERDGKTFIAINLALSLAIVEKRVLFIDGDLRRATASSLWDAPKRGLVDYLDGRIDTYEPLLLHPKDYPTLDVLPVGLPPVNPVELLRSSLFSHCLETVRNQYDVIIIDSPTTGLLADAEIIGQNADHILFVIRAGHYRRNRLEELNTSMPGGNGHIPYIVLNGVSIDNTKYNQFLHYVYSSSIQLH
jgi:capsular exopolysaccharide synthesis family protein